MKLRRWVAALLGVCAGTALMLLTRSVRLDSGGAGGGGRPLQRVLAVAPQAQLPPPAIGLPAGGAAAGVGDDARGPAATPPLDAPDDAAPPQHRVVDDFVGPVAISVEDVASAGEDAVFGGGATEVGDGSVPDGQAPGGAGEDAYGSSGTAEGDPAAAAAAAAAQDEESLDVASLRQDADAFGGGASGGADDAYAAGPAPATAAAAAAGLSGYVVRDDSTHLSCQALGDGFSLCYYENACFRMYTKEVGLARPRVHDRLPRPPRGGGTAAAADAPTGGVWDDRGTRELSAPSWLRHSSVGSAATPMQQALSDYHAYADLGQLDFTYKDSAHPPSSAQALLVPVQFLKEGVARPVPRWKYAAKPGSAAASSGAGGGSGGGGSGRASRRRPQRGRRRGGAGGGVTSADQLLTGAGAVSADVDPATVTVWVRNLYVADAVYAFRKQLWGVAASVAMPLLSAVIANASLHLGLPPPDFLLVATESRPAVIGDTIAARFGWNGGLMQAALAAAAGGAEPLTGRQAYRATLEALSGGGGGGGADEAVEPDDTSSGSGGMSAYHERDGYLVPAHGGTTVLSQADDVPAAAAAGVPLPDKSRIGGKGAVAVPPPPPVTVCADRAVLLGHKGAFVGGAGEANALRALLAAHGPPGLSFPYPSSAEDPRARVKVLVIDRPRVDRPLANARDVLAVIRGYGVGVTYMDGAAYGRLSFAEQARLFNSHQLLVAAHGAALSNVVFMPPRSVVVEIYPRGSWKPGYAKIASALGHTHIPVFSFSGGGKRHADAPYVKIADKDACTGMSYPRLTRGVCFPWVRALPVAVPLGALEHALVAALNLVSYSRVEPRGVAAALAAAAAGGGDGAAVGAGDFEAPAPAQRRRPASGVRGRSRGA